MTKTRTVKAKSPADLLAMVPYVMGFHPEDSIVVLTVGDAVDRFHARVDLPGDPEDVSEVVEAIMGPVSAHGVGRVVLVVYSDDAFLSEQVCDPLIDALDAEGVAVVEAVRADGDRWYSLTGCTSPCCPAEGTPYDVGSHPLTAQSVLDGQVTLASRQELADSLVGGDLEAIEAVDEAAGRHRLRTAAPEAGRVHLVQEGHWVRERVRRYLADGEPLDHEDAGRMAAALVVVEVRDVAWAEMTRKNAAKHVELWRGLVRRCPFDLVAAPAGLLGFAAWLSGDGALAWCAVDRCQGCEPDYRLAALLTQALSGAVPPSCWTPFSRDHLTLFAS